MSELRPADSSHPRSRDLYTPINEDILHLLQGMRDAHGSWHEVCRLTHTRVKVLYRLRKDPSQRAISMTKLDEMITATGVGDLRDYHWYTADELVALGVWKKPADPVEGFPTAWKESRRGKRY